MAHQEYLQWWERWWFTEIVSLKFHGSVIRSPLWNSSKTQDFFLALVNYYPAMLRVAQRETAWLSMGRCINSSPFLPQIPQYESLFWYCCKTYNVLLSVCLVLRLFLTLAASHCIWDSGVFTRAHTSGLLSVFHGITRLCTFI